MKTVLIVGGGLQGISTARSLKEVGYNIGLWAPKRDYTRKSSAVSFCGFSEDEDELNALIEFVKTHGIDVAIPMSDKYTLLLSSNKYRIPCKIAAPDIDILNVVADKQKLMELCETNNLPHPITLNADDIESQHISFPLLIKPNHSVGARGIKLVNSFDELEENLPLIQNQYGKCHLQEYIDGDRPYFNIMMFRTKDGRIHSHVILKIIRYYPLKGGSSSMCKTIEDSELIDICSKALDIIEYVGFADFDVLQTSDGEYKIIEINPRVPASLRGAAVSGVNFPAIIVADTLNQKLPHMNYSPGKTLRYLGLDVMWFLSSPKRFKSNWFKFWGKDIFYQEGGLKDFMPMLSSLVQNFSKIQIKNGRICKKNTI